MSYLNIYFGGIFPTPARIQAHFASADAAAMGNAQRYRERLAYMSINAYILYPEGAD